MSVRSTVKSIQDIMRQDTRLRRFVLDLAVRGKLVPQDAGDEPASELVKRIAQEKARLVIEGEIKQEKPLDPISSETEPFKLPKEWAWTRLDALCRLITKGSSPKWQGVNYVGAEEGILFITSENVGNYEVRKLDDLKYVEARFRDIEPRSMLKRGDILMNLVGASIGRTAIYSLDAEANINQAVALVRLIELPEGPSARYLLHYFNSPSAVDFMLGSRVTTAQPNMSLTDTRQFPVPLPPLAEQHRIVAKVDELMMLCDRLEVARSVREATRDRLTAASLVRLSAPDPDTFHDDARFALDALPALTTCPEQIKRLRQTILNLAVCGKLVPQDPKDEPVEHALRAVRAERDELIRTNFIRREKPLAPIRDDEPPFDVPATWTWTRIGEAALFTQYGTSAKSSPSERGVPVLTMGNIQDGLVVWSNEKRMPEDSDELPDLFLKKFDLLYNRTNSAELVGKTGIYLGEDNCRTFASYLIRLRYSLIHSSPRYANLAMNAPSFRESQVIPLIKKQTGQANVNGTALKNMLIPLPPLAEQRRIVARVDELMALCDRLEASLATASATRRRLLDALLAEALAPVDAREMEAAE